MALATYSDLKAAVANWLNRADLTSVIPDFITVAHTELMRDLRGHLRLQVRSTSFSITSEYVATPSDFLELVSMYLQTNPRRWLFGGGGTFDTNSDRPFAVQLVGSTGGTEYFRFNPPPDQTYTATIEYYGKLAAMANSNDTNWILTDYPMLYLYRALQEGATYLQDSDKAQNYSALYQDALAKAKLAGNRARYGGAPLMVLPG